MDKRKVILIVVLVVAILFAAFGIFIKLVFYNNDGSIQKKKKDVEKKYITLDEMYCNIKESKRIVKIKLTIEIIDNDTYKEIEEKQFLVRDEINKIIRNKKEEELQGKEGQLALQDEIKSSLVELFKSEGVTNVYFDDLIIQ